MSETCAIIREMVYPHALISSSSLSRYDHSIVGPDPFRVAPLQHLEAAGVAIAKRAFGEGTERFAYQFFEVAQDGVTVVGEPLVAKSSRFVMEHHDQEDQKSKFLRRFCRIHHQAAKVADAFNAKLDSIKTLDEDTARVSFLPCSVYVLTDPNKGVLTAHVERRLFGAFQKWNNNNGVRTLFGAVLNCVAVLNVTNKK